MRSLLPHCPAFSGLGSRLCGASLWHQCAGWSFPRSLAPALLPWTTLPEAAAWSPSCLPMSPSLHQFVGTALGDLDQTLAQLCRLCKLAASRRVLAMLRPHGWLPARGVGLGPWGQSLGARLSLPLTADPHRISRQAGTPQSFLQELLDRRALVQPFWGGAWYLLGETFPFPANRCLATARPCPVPQRCFGLPPSPSTTCPAALQAGEIAQGSAPGGQFGAGSGSCQGSWRGER